MVLLSGSFCFATLNQRAAVRATTPTIHAIPLFATANAVAGFQNRCYIHPTSSPKRNTGPFRGVSAAGGVAHAQGTPRKGPYGGGFRPQATRSGVQDGESPVDRSVIPPFRHRKGLPPARRGPRGEGRAEPDHRPGAVTIPLVTLEAPPIPSSPCTSPLPAAGISCLSTFSPFLAWAGVSRG